MACCGAKKKQTPRRAQAPTPGALPGAGGVVKLEFLGKGEFAKRSAGTGVYYRFSPKHRFGYADRGDAITLLEISENGDKLFRSVGAFDIPKPPPEISSVVKGIGADMVRVRARRK
jgi:hypothetical protein